MWRTRIRNADFWFKQWASNQPRDDYWAENCVRGNFEDVQVPVFVMSGWQDGYKNPVERIVSGLSALGKPVQGLLGPWGHKYPFGGYPGPRIAWLQYTVTHCWDKWLKGKTPPPATDCPSFRCGFRSRKAQANLCVPTRRANGSPRTPPGAG